MAIKVALMGLGAIGRGIARCALQKQDLEIVAAIDLDPHRVGKKLSDVVDAETSGRFRTSLFKLAQRHVVLFAALQTPLLREIIDAPLKLWAHISTRKHRSRSIRRGAAAGQSRFAKRSRSSTPIDFAYAANVATTLPLSA